LNRLDNSRILRTETIEAIRHPDVRGVLTKGRILIGSDRALTRLGRHGFALLPVIEDVLVTYGGALIAEADPHLGVIVLSGIIHLYAELTYQHNWSAKPLLMNSTGEIRRELLKAFFQGYGPMRGTKRWRPVPEWLHEAVNSICEKDPSPIAIKLQKALKS
jgi:hypothetical protein